MSIKNIIIKNSSYNLAVYFLLSVVALITLPHMVAALGLASYGLFVLFNSVTPLASVLEFGVTSSLIRELALPDRTLKERHAIWQTGYFLMILTGVITVFLLAVVFYFLQSLPLFASLSQYDYFLIVFYVLFAVFLDRLGNHYLTLVQSEQDFTIYAVRNLLVGLGNTLFSMLAAIITKSLPVIFLVQLICYALGSLIPLLHNRKFFHGLAVSPKYDATISSRLIGFGWRNFIGRVTSQLEGQISRYLIGFMLNPAAVGLFNIPQTLTQKTAGIISQIASAIYPMSAKLQTKSKIGKLVILTYQLELGILMLGLIGIYLFNVYGQDLLNLWLNESALVGQIIPVMKILLWWLLLSALTPIPSMILDGLNHPIIPSLSAVVTLVFEIFFLLKFIPTMGILGAATALFYGAIFGVLPFLALFFWILRHEQLKISST